jgi:hypothetical protein
LFRRQRLEAYWLPFLTTHGAFVLGDYGTRCGGREALSSMASMLALVGQRMLDDILRVEDLDHDYAVKQIEEWIDQTNKYTR